jgi:hypothetical protein
MNSSEFFDFYFKDVYAKANLERICDLLPPMAISKEELYKVMMTVGSITMSCIHDAQPDLDAITEFAKVINSIGNSEQIVKPLENQVEDLQYKIWLYEKDMDEYRDIIYVLEKQIDSAS